MYDLFQSELLTIFLRYASSVRSCSNLSSDSTDVNGSSGIFSDSIRDVVAPEIDARWICIKILCISLSFASIRAICVSVDL